VKMNSVKNRRGGGETMQFNFSNAKKTQHNSLAIKLFNIKAVQKELFIVVL